MRGRGRRKRPETLIRKKQGQADEVFNTATFDPPRRDQVDERLRDQYLSDEDNSDEYAPPADDEYETVPLTQPMIPIVRHTKIQRVGQEVVRIVEAIAPTYLIGQTLPPVPGPWSGALSMGAPGANYWLTDVFIALNKKPRPLSGVKAQGNGNLKLGVIRVTFTCGVALFAVSAFGIGAEKLISNLIPAQNHTSDANYGAADSLSYYSILLQNPVLMSFFKAISGYTLFRLTASALNKMWDCRFAKKEEFDSDEQTIFIQDAFGYTVRFFIDAACTETILYCMSRAAAADPRIQIAIFFATDCTQIMGKHFAYNLHPIKSLVKEEDEIADQTCHPKVVKSMSWRIGAQLLFCVAGYGLLELTCSMLSNRPDTLGKRMTLYLAAASPLVIDLTARQLAKVPAVQQSMTNVAGFMGSLFCRKRKPIEQEAVQKMLTQAPGIN